ncbi:MAG: hypothetical protein IJ057_04210 [Bacteroidales bacterium]|nr:hypothetical protein [Bacteroidales bacterium]
MKHNFRILIGMLLFAIPLCLNAQVKPVKPGQTPEKAKVEKTEKEKIEKEKREMEKREKRDHKGGPEMPKISGFVQGLYQANLDNEGELTSNTIRMRRVRLSVDGTLYKGLSYKIQGDFSRSLMLVDAFLKYKVCNEFAIQAGQFKTPFTLESPINPVNLEIFDYGEVIQKLGGYSDVCGVGGIGRDIGLMATGSLFPVKGEEGIKYHVVDYAVGVFNGNGPTTTDNNNRKDLVGRLEVHPGLKALTLSGSYYYGKYKSSNDAANVATGETNLGHGTRNRWAVGGQFNDGTLLVRSEYVSGQTGYQAGTINDLGTAITEDRFLNSNGFYAVAGYNFKFGKDKSQKLMPVLRYEHFTADQAIEKGGTNYYTVGLNYWPLKSVNLKCDYSLIQTEAGTNSHRIVGILSYKF